MLVAIAAVALLSGCSTMTPARYTPSADTNQALKKLGGKKMVLAPLSAPAKYEANCRLMGPIKAADGMSIPQFITQAFNDEFKFADTYAADGMALQGDIRKIAFSSMAGLTGGWWELELALRSPNGKTLEKSSRTEFKSGFDAITACNQTAQALGSAVQDLVKATVTDPGFGALLQ